MSDHFNDHTASDFQLVMWSAVSDPDPSQCAGTPLRIEERAPSAVDVFEMPESDGSPPSVRSLVSTQKNWVMVGDVPPPDFIFLGGQYYENGQWVPQRELFRITNKGDVKLSEGISVDEAAKKFWELVPRYMPHARPELTREEAAEIQAVLRQRIEDIGASIARGSIDPRHRPEQTRIVALHNKFNSITGGKELK